MFSLDQKNVPFPVLEIDPVVFSAVGPLEEHLSVAPAFRAAAPGKDDGEDPVSRIGDGFDRDEAAAVVADADRFLLLLA